jgi:hypothetical protein
MTTNVRKRGLQQIGIALLLLLAVLFLLGRCEPESGPYPIAVQPFVHLGWLGSVVSLALGLFHAICGAPDAGPFRLVRRPLAILISVFAVPIAVVGGFVLHGALSHEGDRSHDSDADWDWD